MKVHWPTMAVYVAVGGCGHASVQPGPERSSDPQITARTEPSDTHTATSEHPALLFPESLPSPGGWIPASLRLFVVNGELEHASREDVQEKVDQIAGSRVRWWLRSWGPEVRTVGGFETPSGVQPSHVGSERVGRVRLIDPNLPPDADLGTIHEHNQPIVMCLAAVGDSGDSTFIQRTGFGDGMTTPYGEAWVEGTVWGLTGEGPNKELWLLDCKTDPPTDRPYGWEDLAAELRACPECKRFSRTSALQCPRRHRGQERYDWASECHIALTGWYDISRERWVTLTTESSEDSLERLHLSAHTNSGVATLFESAFGERAVEVLRRRLRRVSRLPRPANLAVAASYTNHSLNRYSPMVELGGPFDGWLLYVTISQDLNQPEKIAWLIEKDGASVVELARDVAPVGPCDGMWYCDVNMGECGEEGLRAEGKLCVQPLGIDTVQLAPDGSSMLLLGTVQVAGHGGYPDYAWRISLTDEALAATGVDVSQQERLVDAPHLASVLQPGERLWMISAGPAEPMCISWQVNRNQSELVTTRSVTVTDEEQRTTREWELRIPIEISEYRFETKGYDLQFSERGSNTSAGTGTGVRSSHGALVDFVGRNEGALVFDAGAAYLTEDACENGIEDGMPVFNNRHLMEAVSNMFLVETTSDLRAFVNGQTTSVALVGDQCIPQRLTAERDDQIRWVQPAFGEMSERSATLRYDREQDTWQAEVSDVDEREPWRWLPVTTTPCGLQIYEGNVFRLCGTELYADAEGCARAARHRVRLR